MCIRHTRDIRGSDQPPPAQLVGKDPGLGSQWPLSRAPKGHAAEALNLIQEDSRQNDGDLVMTVQKMLLPQCWADAIRTFAGNASF